MTLGRIPPQSRYNAGAGGSIGRSYSASTGNVEVSVLRTLPSKINTSYRLYIWRQGDRPDLVASMLLQNPRLWWSILDANPEVIDPTNIPAGSVIRVPITPVMGQGTLVQ
jgi:hypothetical protein